jgi:hypothetical protein
MTIDSQSLTVAILHKGHDMKKAASLLMISAMFAMLQACGGGGTSYERDNAVVINPSQTDVLNMAKLGASYNEKLAQFYIAHLKFTAGYLQTFAVLNTGSTTDTALVCTDGGTADVVVTKAATYLGLKKDDTVKATFKQCKVGTTITDGVLNVRTNIDINAPNTENQLAFTVTETDLSLSVAGIKTRGNMTLTVIPVTPSSTNFNYQYIGFTPSKQEFFQAGGTSPALILTHTQPDGSVGETAAVKSYAASGTLGISAGSSSLSFDLITAPVLIGSLPVSGNLIPTSGEYRMRNISGFTKLAVKVSAGATAATVTGYYDGAIDGTPDSSQDLPYSSLYL